MLTQLLFFVILSSGSLYCATFSRKKYEEILPLTVMGIVTVIFLFGLLGALKAGVYTVLILALLLCILTVIRLIRKKEYHEFLQNTVTPGMIVFLLCTILFSLWNYGKLASSWDEFSHWIDIVKAMTTIDDFGTNALSNSAFQSYPPAMSIFQYFLQRSHMLLHPEAGFGEWRVFFAYQIFAIAILLPVFRKCTFSKPADLLIKCIAALAAPLLFYNNFYCDTYIDPILGILSAAGFICIFLQKEKDIFYSLYIWLLCAMLVLCKDAGLLFALFLGAAYLLDLIARRAPNEKTVSKKQLFHFLITSLSIFLPKFLWKNEIVRSNATISFDNQFDFSIFLDLILGKDETYRSDVLKSFRNALFTTRIELPNIGIQINYFALLVLTILSFFLIYHLFRSKKPQLLKKTVLSIAIIQPIVYIAGLAITYAFQFSEYEATRLASFPRYLNIAFLAGFLTVLFLFLEIFNTHFSNRKIHQLLILGSLLIILPIQPLIQFASGDYVEASQDVREEYNELTDKILKNTSGSSKIYIISQEDKGFDYWVLRFNVRPNTTNSSFSWSIGESFYDGDIWTLNSTAEAWKETLIEQYDYVAIYKLNSYFKEHFSVLFADPTQIRENAVYKVDKRTGQLSLCQ